MKTHLWKSFASFTFASSHSFNLLKVLCHVPDVEPTDISWQRLLHLKTSSYFILHKDGKNVELFSNCKQVFWGVMKSAACSRPRKMQWLKFTVDIKQLNNGWCWQTALFYWWTSTGYTFPAGQWSTLSMLSKSQIAVLFIMPNFSGTLLYSTCNLFPRIKIKGDANTL